MVDLKSMGIMVSCAGGLHLDALSSRATQKWRFDTRLSEVEVSSRRQAALTSLLAINRPRLLLTRNLVFVSILV